MVAGVQEEIFPSAKRDAFSPQAHDVSSVVKNFICGQLDGNKKKTADLPATGFSN